MPNRGRPATGRSTKVCRIPIDMDVELALNLYYEIHPKLLSLAEESKHKATSPRWERLIKALEDLGY